MSANETVEKVLSKIEAEGFEVVEARDSIEYFAKMKVEDPEVWGQLKRSVRKRSKEEESPFTYNDVEQWAKSVRSKAEDLKRQRESEEAWEAAKKKSHDEIELGSDAELARFLKRDVAQESGGVPPVFDYRSLYRYDPQAHLWREESDEYFKALIQEYDGTSFIHKSAKVNNVPDPSLQVLGITAGKARGAVECLEAQVDEHGTEDEPGFFDAAPKGFMFENTFVRPTDDGLAFDDPSPELRARIGASVPYDPNAPAAQFDRYLKSVFRGDEDAEQKRRLLVEFCGACLLGVAPRFRKALVLYDGTDDSSGENGKSVLLKLLEMVLPTSAVASLAPQDMNDSQFQTAQLEGARINVDAELPEDDILAGGKVKQMITADLMKAEPKNVDPYHFRPQAGHIFSANDFPRVQATDGAFWKRWIVLGFNYKFTPKGERGRDRIQNFEEKIADSELAGVLSRLVKAGQNVLERGHFVIPESSKALKRQWRQESNPIRQFLIDEATNYTTGGPSYNTESGWAQESNRHVKARDLYDAYTAWASVNGFASCNMTTFGKRAGKLLDKKRKSSGIVYRVRLKPRRQRVEGQNDANWRQ